MYSIFLDNCGGNWQKDQVPQNSWPGVYDEDEEIFKHWIPGQILDHDNNWHCCPDRGFLPDNLQRLQRQHGSKICRHHSNYSEDHLIYFYRFLLLLGFDSCFFSSGKVVFLLLYFLLIEISCLKDFPVLLVESRTFFI